MKKFEVRTSTIEGKGIFAVADFKKGEVVLTITGPVISYPTTPDKRIGPNWFNIGPNTWQIADKACGWNFFNHCCKPNAILRNNADVVTL